MKAFPLLPTLLLTLTLNPAPAAAATEKSVRKDLELVDTWYKRACQGRLQDGEFTSEANIVFCISSGRRNTIEPAYFHLPHVERGDPPMESAACQAVAESIKSPFDSQKAIFDILQTKHSVCLAKDSNAAEKIKQGLESVMRTWGEGYLPRFHANSDSEDSAVFYVYQEWDAPRDSIVKAIEAWKMWGVTCAAE